MPATQTGRVLARTGSTQHPFLFASVALIGLGSLGAVAGRRRRHDGGGADSPRTE
jgi:LPXTG-motif cell wall-anchored protein